MKIIALDHDWGAISYQLSEDRRKVAVVECCKGCGQVRKYERPNKRLSPELN